LAVTVAVAVRVKVHVLALFPPLEQAPDQIPSRPFEIVSVIDVLVVNRADPVLPTATLIPAGLEVTRSPLRPVAVTVSVAVAPGGVTVSAAVRITPAALAVMLATVDAVTDVVVMVNVALVAPAATVTLAGTVAAALLLESVTPNPPAGAADVNVTVPCADVPPVTLVGLTETADSEAGGGGGVTVSVAVFVAPPYPPVIVTGVDALTAVVVTLNVALVAPAATVTLAGTVATAMLLLDNVTTAPPVEGKPRPYDDDFAPGGLLRYRYRGIDAGHRDNVVLRAIMQRQSLDPPRKLERTRVRCGMSEILNVMVVPVPQR
jgi:hypothetical protein